MTWVRQARKPEHDCSKPSTVDASLGDLWRCDDCGRIWRVGRGCDYCDRQGVDIPHVGQHRTGWTWRRATWGQRVFYGERTKTRNEH